jgi:AtzE family amidohydrolase
MLAPAMSALGAGAIAAGVRTGARSATAVVRDALARIERLNPALNAFTAVTADRARARAAAIDRAVARGENPGPLAGVPFAAKNLFDVAGVTTLSGSIIERRRPPAARDATAVARLEAAGAICVGCLNMDEYAYGFTTENSHYGPSRNPHDTARTAGGSSGGSGAAVAGGLVPITLGTDTNGSIRVPASLNGIFGLKPTYGRLSRTGSVLFVPSLDHIGPFARDVADLAAAYDALQGADPDDPAQAERPVEPVGPVLGQGIGGLRIARLAGHFARSGLPEAQHATARIAAALAEAAGENLGEVTLERAAAARAAAFLITAAEGAQMRLPDLRARAEDFEPLTRDRLLAGALIPAQWVLHAQRVRRLFQTDLRAVFANWDILVAPATPTPATPLGQEMLEADGQSFPLRASFGVYTQPISCIGLPVLAVPVQNALGLLPIGVQLIAAPWAEAKLFRAASVLERAGLCAAPVAPAFAGETVP